MAGFLAAVVLLPLALAPVPSANLLSPEERGEIVAFQSFAGDLEVFYLAYKSSSDACYAYWQFQDFVGVYERFEGSRARVSASLRMDDDEYYMFVTGFTHDEILDKITELGNFAGSEQVRTFEVGPVSLRCLNELEREKTDLFTRMRKIAQKLATFSGLPDETAVIEGWISQGDDVKSIAGFNE